MMFCQENGNNLRVAGKIAAFIQAFKNFDTVGGGLASQAGLSLLWSGSNLKLQTNVKLPLEKERQTSLK
jgi:hypothetical protein